MSIRGVIFDFDGTLVDTLPDIADAVNEGLKTYGLPPQPAAQVRAWIGEGMPTLCRRAVQDAANVPIDEMAAKVTSFYREHRLEHVVLYPGVADLLDALTERGIHMAILSNKPHEHMGPMVEALLGRWSFLAVEGYHDEERRKPDPRIALAIVAKMNLEPRQVLMVGDSATDVKTGINAGLLPVGVPWGYRDRQELIDNGARHIVEQPDEIFHFLDFSN